MLPLSRYFAFRQRCPILEPHQAFAPDHPHVPDSSPMSSGMFFPAILRENSAKSRQHQCRSFPAGRYRLVSSARFRPPPPGAPAIAQRCPAGAILRYPGRKRVPCPFLGDVGGFHALSGFVEPCPLPDCLAFPVPLAPMRFAVGSVPHWGRREVSPTASLRVLGACGRIATRGWGNTRADTGSPNATRGRDFPVRARERLVG
jgi:hypothetical protein